MTTSAVTSVRIWAEAFRSQDGSYTLFTGSPSTKVHFYFNEGPLESSFSLSDCTIPSDTRWTTELTRDPDDARHYWVGLEALEGVEYGGGRLTLDLADVTDHDGNAVESNSESYFISDEFFTVDTVPPTLARITIDRPCIRVGEGAQVWFYFSENVTEASVKAALDLSQAHGTLSDPRSLYGNGVWVALFTPTADTENTKDCKIGLDISQVQDLQGNTGQTDASGGGPVYSNSYVVNTLHPLLAADAITYSESILTRDTMSMTVTVTFSDPVTGLRITSLREPVGGNIGEKGTLSPLVASTPDADGYSAVWTAILTAPRDKNANNSENNKITVSLDGVTDRDGYLAAGTVESSNTYAIDVKWPTIVTTMSDTNLGIGEVATITLRFSEKVTGLTLDDFANGQYDQVPPTLSDLVSSDGGQTWTFKLTPADLSDRGSPVNISRSIFLPRGSVADAAGNSGPVDDEYIPDYTVDHSRPVLASSRIAYASEETDSTLDAGETATVTFVFSEAVTGFDTHCVTAYTDDAGSATMINPDAAGGMLSNPVSTDGGITWTATLTAPTASTTITDVGLDVDMGCVTDASENKGEGTASSDFRYTVDTTVSGTRPSATIALADSALTAGETTTVTIAFSERVNGFDATDVDLTNANGTLGTLSTTDDITWTAPFTPTAGFEGATNTISLNLTGVTNDTGRTGAGTAASSNYAISTIERPLATITLADTSLAIGETTTVTFAFSKAVPEFTRNDVDLYDANGTLGDPTTNDNGRTWTATFTPTANVENETNTISVNLAGVTNPAGRASTVHADSPNYRVDTRAPVFYRAMVNSARLTLGCAEGIGLDATHIPPATAFAVHVDGVPTAVTAVRVQAQDNIVSLTLATAVTNGQAVTVAYTAPTTDDDANAIQDTAGNDAASFSAMPAYNRTPAPQGPASSARSAPLTPSDPTHKNADSDGLPGSAGAAPVAGDGNGDGTPDGTQAAVASTRLVLSSPTGASQPADAANSTPVTLVAGSLDGKLDPDSSGARITRLEQEDAPAELPQGMETPLGLLRFEATLAPGHSSEAFSLYVDPALGVGGYWAQDSTGTWVNLSSAPYGGQVVHEGGQLRLDFEIADGGPFDADGQANGAITAPGAAARMPLSLMGQTPDAAGGLWF
ncbi:hypothetical protein D8B23_18650 [Verminephrobacter aporrectodeae subsp. tuberculatae]|uniref:Ig-like domain-containing protein n=1 Tax=Verminephrobacter aporrectodeae TaxID=1110389 RepID=UPI00224430BE|nr:Ig-like domain-containing protein [Verminephrobacter aporrectodeae]MCW8200365.1 hypothetical protein [Verminephrobacter aporrectodeae subsp. tuberculatae]